MPHLSMVFVYVVLWCLCKIKMYGILLGTIIIPHWLEKKYYFQGRFFFSLFQVSWYTYAMQYHLKVFGFRL